MMPCAPCGPRRAHRSRLLRHPVRSRVLAGAVAAAGCCGGYAWLHRAPLAPVPPIAAVAARPAETAAWPGACCAAAAYAGAPLPVPYQFVGEADAPPGELPQAVAEVPEPGSLVLLGAALGAIAARRRS